MPVETKFSPQTSRHFSMYRMMRSTHPTNSGRTFAIAILRTGPMHLHGWKVHWSHHLWCRLHTVFTARVQAREIAIRIDLTLCSDATRVSTPHGYGHPSKFRSLTMQLNFAFNK